MGAPRPAIAPAPCPAHHRQPVHTVLSRWLEIRDHLAYDCLGGPRPFTAALVINVQKGGTLPFVLWLMWHHDVWSPTAWSYLALHGGYGLLWLLKDRWFPDPAWERRVTVAGALLMLATVLGPYWLAPWLLVSRDVTQPTWVLVAAGVGWLVGVVTMLGADAQKHRTLRRRPGLITTGWFARVRHPNYLGEMLVYGSFAVLADHWAPWAVLAVVWGGVFLPNMLRKESRMARHPEWPAYVRRTGFLLPRIRTRP